MRTPQGYRWQTPHRGAALIVLLAVLTLLGLGMWQVYRLQWKETLIAEIALANQQPPLAELPLDEQAIRDLAWRRIELTGHFLHDKEFHLAARYYRSQLGYHILTPFVLNDGRIVLLNRGWVPTEKKLAETRLEGQEAGTLSLIGQVRTDPDRNPFTPEADPARNLWFWRDIEGMRQASGLPLLPVTLDVLHRTPPGGYPIASDGEIKLRNDHLGYAITWFSLALAAVVMFLLYHLQPLERKPA